MRVPAVILLTIVVLLLGGALYYPTEKAAPSVVRDSAPSRTEQSGSIPTGAEETWTEFQIADAGITFEHPPEWECTTRKVHAYYPERRQTTCTDTSNPKTNPDAVIDTPFVDGNRHDVFEITHEEEFLSQGVVVHKEVLQSSRPNPTYFVVVYTQGDSERARSFQMSLPLRTDEGMSLEEIETLGDRIVHSLSVSD